MFVEAQLPSIGPSVERSKQQQRSSRAPRAQTVTAVYGDGSVRSFTLRRQTTFGALAARLTTLESGDGGMPLYIRLVFEAARPDGAAALCEGAGMSRLNVTAF
jgi:hypothetical protein